MKTPDQPWHDEKAAAWIDGIVKNARPGHAVPHGMRDPADNAMGFAKKLVSDFRAVPTENKINAGMWLVGAAFSLVRTYNAARNSTRPDENGESKLQWSNVGLALLNAAIAAGCAYMGAAALRSPAR